jgi:hypothetical protein
MESKGEVLTGQRVAGSGGEGCVSVPSSVAVMLATTSGPSHKSAHFIWVWLDPGLGIDMLILQSWLLSGRLSFWRDWGLDSGLCNSKSGTLPLELVQSILL